MPPVVGDEGGLLLTGRACRCASLHEEGRPGGAAEGGHDAVHPELGTLDDFRRLVRACAEHGLEVALDFAVQCSPDHPWLKEHPEWFHRRPDGTLKYAENPPKRYQDIHNVDWDTTDRKGLWNALRDVVAYLREAPRVPASAGREVEIGPKSHSPSGSNVPGVTSNSELLPSTGTDVIVPPVDSTPNMLASTTMPAIRASSRWLTF